MYHLNTGPKNPTNIFKFKNYLFGATIVVDSARSSGFDNDSPRNIMVFVFDLSSSLHADNHRNNFIVLSEGSRFGINVSFGSAEKSFVFTLVMQTQHFAWVCIGILIIVICLLMESKSLS